MRAFSRRNETDSLARNGRIGSGAAAGCCPAVEAGRISTAQAAATPIILNDRAGMLIAPPFEKEFRVELMQAFL
jgi:hypothetical protein